MQTFEGYTIRHTIPVTKSESVMFGVNESNKNHPYAIIITEHRRGHKTPYTYVSSQCHDYAESILLLAQHLEYQAKLAIDAQANSRQQRKGMQL